jgi:hypothetical protein
LLVGSRLRSVSLRRIETLMTWSESRSHLKQKLESKSMCPSCALNRRSENVIIEVIVIPKLELCNVKWQVFGANLVERTPRLKDAMELEGVVLDEI